MLKTFADTTTQQVSNQAGGVNLTGWILIVVFVGLVLAIAGAIIGMLISKKMFEKQIKENPPISEKAIRAMFLQMGRRPSEAQIKAVMRSMKNAK